MVQDCARPALHTSLSSQSPSKLHQAACRRGDMDELVCTHGNQWPEDFLLENLRDPSSQHHYWPPSHKRQHTTGIHISHLGFFRVVWMHNIALGHIGCTPTVYPIYGNWLTFCASSIVISLLRSGSRVLQRRRFPPKVREDVCSWQECAAWSDKQSEDTERFFVISPLFTRSVTKRGSVKTKVEFSRVRVLPVHATSTQFDWLPEFDMIITWGQQFSTVKLNHYRVNGRQ